MSGLTGDEPVFHSFSDWLHTGGGWRHMMNVGQVLVTVEGCHDSDPNYSVSVLDGTRDGALLAWLHTL